MGSQIAGQLGTCWTIGSGRRLAHVCVYLASRRQGGKVMKVPATRTILDFCLCFCHHHHYASRGRPMALGREMHLSAALLLGTETTCADVSRKEEEGPHLQMIL